ncbi:MAG: hypothetical protein QGG04_09315 [Candidatus Marinimicrobia bacterium]|nr:hypothetical protein [Candidatus Neomarinimicrobiota bacterium]
MTDYKKFETKLRGLLENNPTDNDTPDNPTEMMKEIIEAYKEAKELTDEYLFEDHLKWLKWSFEKGHFEFPDDYDFNTNRWTIGFLLAQVERYGGVVIETKKGLMPYTDHHHHHFHRNAGKKGFITEK